MSEELEPILVWDSLPLGDVIRRINKFSNNVMTRQLLYTLGLEASDRPGTRAGGVDVIRDHLASRGLNVDSLVIDNGAGLSRQTRISAQLLADMLQLAQQPPYGAEFMASMSIGGLDGTTRRRFEDDEALGRSHLKTGSIDHVAAIAGYVHALSGTTYVVAAMINATDAHRGHRRGVSRRPGRMGTRVLIHDKTPQQSRPVTTPVAGTSRADLAESVIVSVGSGDRLVRDNRRILIKPCRRERPTPSGFVLV